jgi:3-deoxy-D-manno-octulosonic-acid transferase
MILAPRHPERFGEVERLLRERKLRYLKRSETSGLQSGDHGVLLLDTLGDLPRYYGCADVAFVGGSLVPAGGHNLIEPARWGKPVLVGPHRSNIAATARELLEQGGAVEVRDRQELFREVVDLLSNGARASAMGRRARHVADADKDVVSRSMRLLCRQLRGAPSLGAVE